MKLSLIIVSAGTIPELKECLDRILSCAGSAPEIIFVDDSPAQTLGLFAKEAYKDKLKVVFQGGNTGASAARNRGVEESGGEYLLFLDSDCLISDDFFANLQYAEPLLQKENIAGLSFKVLGKRGIFSQGLRRDFLFRTHNLKRLGNAIQEVEGINTCCCLLQKKLFEARGFREDFHYIFEDMEFSLYLRSRGLRFFYYPFCTAFHQGGSFKTSYSRKTFFSFRNRLLTVLAYSKHPFLFFVGSLPYELMRTLKLFLLDPFLLLRALSKVFLSFRQRAHAG